MTGCLWCGTAFTPRSGGKAQRFCRPSCRVAFHHAARAWAEREVVAGRVTVAEIKAALRINVHVATAGPDRGKSPEPVPRWGSTEEAPVSAVSHPATAA